MKRKIYIRESQYKSLCEAEWNFHFGEKHDMSPHLSDNKVQMGGRETGHFGSGTYFSTYPTENLNVRYDSSDNNNPNFIQIGERLYRVDFDLYKNLYRVRSKKEGDVLYTMCSELNRMYNKIAYMGDFKVSNASYNNSENYQKIKRNADALGLKCPSYYELTRMAQNHNGIQSFSTLFMELNGYNGVNVSGIPFYDNTKHGSVIYDLSKVDGDIMETDVNIPFNLSHTRKPYNDTVAYDSFENYELAALDGESFGWSDKLNDMPPIRALRILKNYTKSGNVVSLGAMRDMNDDLLGKYLAFLYHISMRKDNDDLKYHIDDIGNGIIPLIERVGAYYWVNYSNNSYDTFLIKLLSNFSMNLDWDMDSEQEKIVKKEYFNKISRYLTRELTANELEYLGDYYGIEE